MWMPASYLICVLLYVSCMLWPAPDLTSRSQLLLFPVLWPNLCMYIGLHACTWSDTSRAPLILIFAFTEKTDWSTSWSGFSDSDWVFSNVEHRRFMTWYSGFFVVVLSHGGAASRPPWPNQPLKQNALPWVIVFDEVAFIKQLLLELGIKTEAVPIYEDN